MTHTYPYCECQCNDWLAHRKWVRSQQRPLQPLSTSKRAALDVAQSQLLQDIEERAYVTR